MNFKKSSMPMVFAAMLCILLGIGLIVLCIFLPSGEDSVSEGERSSVSETDHNLKDSSEDPEASDIPVSEEPVNDIPIYSELDPAVQEGLTSPESSEPGVSDSLYVSSKDDPLLVLANVDNPLPDDFEVGELEQVQGNYYLDIRAASYAREMISDAEDDGITLQLCSAYRAKDLQQTLFTNKYNSYIQSGWTEDDAYAKTATIIAIPGTSEHQTGLCMDVVTPSYQVLDAGYAETDAAKWLYDNAYKYGFILRYPKDKQDITKIIFEPWHYRFVGVENAKLIKDSGLCLEEFLETLE